MQHERNAKSSNLLSLHGYLGLKDASQQQVPPRVTGLAGQSKHLVGMTILVYSDLVEKQLHAIYAALKRCSTKANLDRGELYLH